jgi:hypothetical protein
MSYPPHFSPDVQDLLRLFHKHKVRYLIVGAEAVIYHGYPRLTGDTDIFFDRNKTNCQKLFTALYEFWGGRIPGISSARELSRREMVFQFGVPPNRIDLISTVSGVGFAEAWKGKVGQSFSLKKEAIPVYFIGLAELIKNKEAAGRPKDLADLKYLREAAKKSSRFSP